MVEDINYFWVRIFDYVYERDSAYDNESHGKGVMLDEFYLKDVKGGREGAKNIVKEKYVGHTSKNIGFAKPKKKNGIYAIVMESNKYFYDRFYSTIDTFCFWHTCHKPIKGKAAVFPKVYIGEKKQYEDGLDEFKDSVYFCSPECKRHFHSSLNPVNEGEFQTKEEGAKGDIYGYIYLIYNRAQDMYYIGKSRYMPFFRWQEHIKSPEYFKGDIKDLTFSVLSEVARNRKQNEEYNETALSDIEAWWISKYIEEGYNVFNVSKPKITMEYLKERFNEMVAKNKQLSLFQCAYGIEENTE